MKANNLAARGTNTVPCGRRRRNNILALRREGGMALISAMGEHAAEHRDKRAGVSSKRHKRRRRNRRDICRCCSRKTRARALKTAPRRASLPLPLRARCAAPRYASSHRSLERQTIIKHGYHRQRWVQTWLENVLISRHLLLPAFFACRDLYNAPPIAPLRT